MIYYVSTWLLKFEFIEHVFKAIVQWFVYPKVVALYYNSLASVYSIKKTIKLHYSLFNHNQFCSINFLNFVCYSAVCILVLLLIKFDKI